MDGIVVLFILGIIVAALAVGTFFALIFLAILIYVVKNLYPPIRRVVLWASRLENLIPLLILYAVLLFLIIFILVIAFRLPPIATLLLLLLLLELLIVMVFVGTLLLLALLVYAIRIVSWLYGRWKGLAGALLPQIMRLRIKHDLGKGKGTSTDKDWTAHFAEIRKKLGEEAELARRRISKGGK